MKKDQLLQKRLKSETKELKKTGLILFKRIKLAVIFAVIAWILLAILLLLVLVKYVFKSEKPSQSLPEFAKTDDIRPL